MKVTVVVNVQFTMTTKVFKMRSPEISGAPLPIPRLSITKLNCEVYAFMVNARTSLAFKFSEKLALLY